MKNSCRKSKISFLCLFLVAGFFLPSCGLQEIITINPPVSSFNSSLYSSSDYTNWYCDFYTNEENQSDSFNGTEIYYKIYNNYNDLLTQRNAILNVNTSSNNTAAATRVIETYTYQTLKTYPVISQSLFVPDTGSSVRVSFRPKTYKGNEDYVGDSFESFRAFIKFDGVFRGFVDGTTGVRYLKYDSSTGSWTHSSSISGTYASVNYSDIKLAVPSRYNDRAFDFFDDADTDDDRNVKPKEGENDYVHNSSPSEDNTYYVQFFAVGVAFDEDSLSNTYSLVLDLGSMPIIKEK